MRPDESTDHSRDEKVLAPLAWWGGFFLGPLAGVAVYFAAPPGSVARRHGWVAAVVWSAVLAVWAPFVLWVIVFDGAEPTALLIGLPVVLAVIVGACTIGTLSASRQRRRAANGAA